MQKLAIVGTHSATRSNAPFEDPNVEIWVFNEAPQIEWCKRWDVVFQMHRPEVYAGPHNHVRADHWEWLQTVHPGKTIYMQAPDSRVPNSVEYPLENVLSMIPFRYLTSTASMALALAIYLGYTDISLYGIELTSNSEYAYQAENWIFWVGFALGRGINLQVLSGQMHFEGRIYGYEGDPHLTDFYRERVELLRSEYLAQDKRLRGIDQILSEATLKNRYDLAAQAVMNLESAAIDCGAAAGALGEAELYAGRGEAFTPRQELERHAAKAQQEGEGFKALMHNAGGKCEYVWNVWAQTGRLEAMNQLRLFAKEKRQAAYDCGARLGIYRENLLYMQEYDARITALGGERAMQQLEAV